MMTRSTANAFVAHFLAVATLLWSGRGHADSVVGAASQCLEGESFTLMAADWGSDDPDENQPMPDGYARIDGRSVVSCSLGKSTVKGIIRVYPPADHGMAMGEGYASIEKLEVDGVPVFGHPTAFNWQTAGTDNALIKLRVFIKQDVAIVEVCDSDKCAEQSLVENNGLNYQYQQTMAVLPEKERGQLRQEQRFWLKERDPQCALAVQEKHNEPLAFLQCVMLATHIRAVRLLDQQIKSKKPK